MTPPQAAALVPVSNVSDASVPPNGICMCVWTSTPPGTTYLPVASIVRSAYDAQRGSLAGGEDRRDRLAVDEDVGHTSSERRHDRAVVDEDGCHVGLLSALLSP